MTDMRATEQWRGCSRRPEDATVSGRTARARAKEPRGELENLSGQARRLLELVERGDLVADDAAGRRVVET